MARSRTRCRCTIIARGGRPSPWGRSRSRSPPISARCTGAPFTSLKLAASVTIALGSKPITLAANFSEVNGAPVLDFYFDTGGHGTHVAGIAAGHSLFNVAGIDGVAP